MIEVFKVYFRELITLDSSHNISHLAIITTICDEFHIFLVAVYVFDIKVKKRKKIEDRVSDLDFS